MVYNFMSGINSSAVWNIKNASPVDADCLRELGCLRADLNLISLTALFTHFSYETLMPSSTTVVNLKIRTDFLVGD